MNYTKFKKEEINIIKEFFSYFLIDNTNEVFDTCCIRYQTNLAGRYCKNCPNHPMNMLEKEEKDLIYTLLDENKFNTFIEKLKEYNLPYPKEKDILYILDLNK